MRLSLPLLVAGFSCLLSFKACKSPKFNEPGDTETGDVLGKTINKGPVVPFPAPAQAGVGGFIWRKTSAVGRNAGVRPLPNLCSASFEFSKQGESYTADLSTLLNPECFSYSQTANLVLKVYWNGKYQDIPVELESFKQLQAMASASKELNDKDQEVLSFWSETFDPNFNFELRQEFRNLPDDKRPATICSSEERNLGCRDYTNVYTIRVKLNSGLPSSMRSTLDEIIAFQSAQMAQIPSNVKPLVAAIKKLRLERLDLARRHNVGYSAFLLSECGKDTFPVETLFGLELQRVFEKMCTNKEAVTKIIKAHLKLENKDSFALLKEIHDNPKVAVESLEEKMRANMREEARLFANFTATVEKLQNGFQGRLFFTSNHLKAKYLTEQEQQEVSERRIALDKFAFAAIPVNATLHQVDGASVQFRNGKAYVDLGFEKKVKQIPDRTCADSVCSSDSLRVNLGIDLQAGQVLQFYGSALPLAALIFPAH